MEKTKKNLFLRAILRLVLVLPNILLLVMNVGELVKIEAKVAGKSIQMLLIFSLVLASLLVTTWLSVLVFLFLYLASFHINMLASIIIVMFLNIMLTLLVLLVMSSLTKKISFPNTTHHLHAIIKNLKS